MAADEGGHWGVRHAPDLYPEFHDAPRGPRFEAPWDRHDRGDHRQQGPYAGRGPRNYTRSNDRIREEVSDRLADHPWVDASHIEVVVEDGVVTLTGSVEDRTQKRMAEDVADSVSGVRDVNNQLRIDPSTRPEEHRFTQHVVTP
ncbi:MAG: BON domain-containing protein [Chloroflexi bacterium]|nr:BON domain-containing protein [Chloroflexota bacterium]